MSTKTPSMKASPGYLEERTKAKFRVVGSTQSLDLQNADPDNQAEHCIKWIRDNVRIQNPEVPNGIAIFDLYDYQERHVRDVLSEIAKVRRGESAGMHTEKSRQMGDTWMFMAIELYALKFWANIRVLNISRKQDLVDDGGENATADSLHGKVLYMWKRLPVDEKPPLTFKFLRIVNPILGGALIGEAAGSDAGAGGTYDFGLWDETARTEHSFAIYASWQQAVRCPFYLSTPKGKNNLFAWLKKNAPLTFRRHHWTQHPLKSEGLYTCPGGMQHQGQLQGQLCLGGEPRSPWYDQQSEKMPPEILAQEVDISYEASVSGRAFPEFSSERHGLEEIPVEASPDWVISIDPGVRTAAAILFQWVSTLKHCECRVMEAWEGHDATTQTYQDLICLWEKRYGMGTQTKLYITGDPSGFNRDLTDGHSVWGEMRKRFGRHFDTPDWLSNVADRVRITRDLLAGRGLLNGQNGSFCYRQEQDFFADRMEAAKWPTNAEGIVTRETDLDHNEAEHIADALTYGVAYYLGQQFIQLPNQAPTDYRPMTAGLKGQSW